jgi:predicted outer membrane repeat protein
MSWTTAFTNVQDALAAASDPAEIWVAKGVYYPDEGGGNSPDNPNASFVLAEGVALYGGFKFNDKNFSDRNWKTNKTVLSGDLEQNDTVDIYGIVVTTTDIAPTNALHVVRAKDVSGKAVLDGFTITAGQANGSDEDRNGGGLYCNGQGSGDYCNPTLHNVTFSGNFADLSGGGLYNRGDDDGESSPDLKNVKFSGNSVNFYGGAMHNHGRGGKSNPKLTDVIFSDNSAKSGGAMYNMAYDDGISNPELTAVTFTNNRASFRGGAIYCRGEDGECNPVLYNVEFSGNSAGDNGGAMFNEGDGGDSSPKLTNVRFIGNTADDWGGAVYNDGTDDGNCSPTMINVLFSGNYSEDEGGAMYNDCRWRGICKPILINLTFSGNKSDDVGGTMYNNGEYDGIINPQIRNTILWNNQDISGTGTISATIYNVSATVTVSNSLVQAAGASGSGVWTSDPNFIDGGNNIDTNPMFVTPVNPNSAPTKAGNLRLKPASPAIELGDNIYVPVDVSTDLDGEQRIKDADGDGTRIVDMGAYEAKGWFYLYVTKDGSGLGTVTSTPAGIDCGNTCSDYLFEGTSRTLKAEPVGYSKFTGWSGACSGSSDCAVTIEADTHVTATFEATLKVDLPILFR